jgi:hypothetical protein
MSARKGAASEPHQPFTDALGGVVGKFPASPVAHIVEDEVGHDHLANVTGLRTVIDHAIMHPDPLPRRKDCMRAG